MRKKLAIIALLALTFVMAKAQTVVAPVSQFHQTFVNQIGQACAGCKLATFAAGTTTPQATFTDSTGTAQNTNPIILDLTGSANIAGIQAAYKFVLSDPIGNIIFTEDNIPFVCTLAFCPSPTLASLGGVSLTDTSLQTMQGPLAWNGGSTGTPAETTLANLGGLSAVLTTPQATNSALNGVWPSSFFGVKCDGSTDDSTALNSIGTFVAAQPAGSTVTVSFPSNSTCLHASTINTWLVANLHISGNGARLKFSGTGDQIVLHNSVAEVDNVWIDGFVLQGNPASTWGIFADTTQARGELQFINIQDQATGCAHLGNVQLMNKLDITCSAQKATEMGVPQVTQPGIGVQAGDTGEPFANNRYVNITAEGVSGIGLWINTTVDGDVFAGTSESNGTGVQIEPDNEGVAFSGFDIEHNTTAFVDNNGSSVQIATSGFQFALGSEATGVMAPQYLVSGNITPPNGRTACITQDLSGFLTTEFWQSSTTGGQSCGTSRTLSLTPTEAIFPGSVNAANGNIIGTQGTQYHIRQFVTVSSGCTAAANASCQFTVTWPNAFPNATYAMICYLGAATGVGVVVGDASPTSTSTTVSFRDLSGASNTATQTFCEAWE